MNALSRLHHLFGQAWLRLRRRSSADYWESRYRLGLTSGSGSMGELAHFKAGMLNEFVRVHDVRSVIEFGCGDGLQLALANYPNYVGIDVSHAAIELCRRRFEGDATKVFLWQHVSAGGAEPELPDADLALSLDVIYHLLEDDVYRRYLADFFGAARRYAIIYSSNRPDQASAPHVRHREFLKDVSAGFPEFSLLQKIENPYRSQSFADFYVFSRTDA